MAALQRHQLSRMAKKAAAPPGVCRGTTATLGRFVRARFDLDLPGLLNAASRAELATMAEAAGIDSRGRAGEVRERLWHWGACLEAGGDGWLGTAIQPRPHRLGGKLVILGPDRGLSPPAPARPRPVPPAIAPPPAAAEPDSLEALWARADRLIGVRLGPRGPDKGAFGTRVAALLGVRETGDSEPDWRGEVEIKTVPVIRDRSGSWRVSEDPAVAMVGPRPLYKLQRVLWVARIADDPLAPVLSWYYQELTDSIRALVARDLHTRPKGKASTTARGYYLHKRFFADSGFLRSLN